ncbi:hypothetical protein UCRPC4_g03696 [Phaeomoniella chlamydospora]|uniref:Uncharacterized protein n=1 Tax=Phaeomoniella chlamydospora TaxID=158046 RepID=A0A0G2GCR8_PHACM|nr:hypothetical protein UCRPC4_g03696 [Phaeomoniella chlamydospora]
MNPTRPATPPVHVDTCFMADASPVNEEGLDEAVDDVDDGVDETVDDVNESADDVELVFDVESVELSTAEELIEEPEDAENVEEELEVDDDRIVATVVDEDDVVGGGT